MFRYLNFKQELDDKMKIENIVIVLTSQYLFKF